MNRSSHRKDTGDLNSSNSCDNRIVIGDFGGKQMADSNNATIDKVSLAADIVSAYVSYNSVPTTGLA